MAQTLKFGKGTWATKKGSTLSYNDESNNYKPLPFTTTRSSSATRVNKEGLIEVVENDRPRIDYTDSSNGVLLLEKAATNLVPRSEDIVTGWSKSNATVVNNQTTSPNGTLDAGLITATSVTGQHICYDTLASSVTAGADYCISCFVKKSTSRYLRISEGYSNGVIYVDLDNNVITTEAGGASESIMQDYGNGWFRIGFKFTADSSGNSQFALYLNDNSNNNAYAGNGEAIYLWGVQISNGNVASSYIPTSGSTATRVADTASGAGNSEVFNDSEGVLYANIKANQDIATSERITISDGNSSNNRVVLEYDETFGLVKFWVTGGGTTNGEVQISGIEKTQFNKISVLYKSNLLKIYINGFNVGNGTGIVAPTGLDNLKFEQAVSGNNFYGSTKEIGYYDTSLTDLELEKLTSYVSLSEMATELNYKAL